MFLLFNRTKTKDRTDDDSEVIVPVIPALKKIIDEIAEPYEKDVRLFPFILKEAKTEADCRVRVAQENQNIRKRMAKLAKHLGWKVTPSPRILLMDIPASQFLHTNQADEAYIRVGDKSRKLTFEERMQLMYDKGERSYEDTAVYGATIEDIDMDAVAEYAKLVGYGKSPLEYLRENNGFVTTNKKGKEDVSVACILLFGKNPQKFFPRSRTRFIRYEGVDEKVGAEMNVIKDVIFEGTILN